MPDAPFGRGENPTTARPITFLQLVRRIQENLLQRLCYSNFFNRHLEGIGGFYKGILPPILAETPKRATKFFTFEQYKRLFASPDIPVWATLSFAGLMSGCTEAIVICPFEVVKVRLQSEHSVKLSEVILIDCSQNPLAKKYMERR